LDGEAADMDLKLIGESEIRLTIQIENADFSMSDIIHHELLKHPEVSIAGVLSPHPLLNQYNIKMEVKKNSNPKEILLSSSKSALKTANLMLNGANQLNTE